MGFKLHSRSSGGGKVISVILMLVGGLFTVSTCSALFDATNPDKMSLVAGMTIFGVVPLLGGMLLFWKTKKAEKDTHLEFTERMILSLASKNNGILTAFLLAENTTFNLEEAMQTLDQFVIKGHARIEVNDNGGIEYHFISYLKS
ncbi:MAG: hypothetical protein CVV22_05290 [Ignavibacteriae bacterium HGW-Ignavibacteriae-1]|jgi:hypothetical protein|nr:MAG: hypothetical protein CVV22_05290 [Ignavibacteriae bacterium HGW-Ignavibacteriae-1]